MSIVETAPTCPECDDSAASCATCGGYLGWPSPPNNITKGSCRKCAEGIANQIGPTALPALYGVPQQAIAPDAIQTPQAPPSVS